MSMSAKPCCGFVTAGPARRCCCCTGIRVLTRRGIALHRSWRVHTVVCPDLRGYGESSKVPTTADHAPYSKRAMAGCPWHQAFLRPVPPPDQTYVQRESQTIREGLLTDDNVSAIRSLINNTYQIDCGDPNTFAAIKEIAQANAFDPVLDMLDEYQGGWDDKKRLDTWVVDYLGCADTPLNRAIGRKALIAACRRARQPGCKFDSIIVLEGVEGTNKSTAIRVLAGDENSVISRSSAPATRRFRSSLTASGCMKMLIWPV